MRLRFLIALFAAILLYLACDSTLTGPTLPTGPPASPPPEPPSRVDVPFSFDTYRGIIAFGLGHPEQSEDDVLRFVNAAMGRGWNTFQICSETEFWNGSGFPTKPRDTERLEWLLDIIARVPGAQVALVGNCTLKRQVPLSEQLDWAAAVGCVIAGGNLLGTRTCEPGVSPRFQNVAVFTHNEFDNCRGRSDWGGNAAYCAGKQDVANHVSLFRQFGVEWVTADDSFSPPKPGDPPSLTYNFRLENIGASPVSFHPDRTKDGQPWDPSPHQLRELGRHNGLYVLSETVAYNGSGATCDGLRTCDQDRINNYITNCAVEPTCRFTYHCAGDEGGDCLAGEVPTWIPEAR